MFFLSNQSINSKFRVDERYLLLAWLDEMLKPTADGCISVTEALRVNIQSTCVNLHN